MSYSIPQANSDGDTESPIIEPVKPKCLIGISTYNKPLTDEVQDMLSLRFSSSKEKRCELCGVSLSEEHRMPLNVEKAWFNTCGMCYYARNLDQIPHYKKGSIVYAPRVSQETLNALMRVVWCVDYMCGLEPENKELVDFQQVITELDNMFKVQRDVTEGFIGVTDVDVYGANLHLLRPEEYAQRHKLLTNFRWQPDKDLFKDEIAFWVEKDYHKIHPNNTTGTIKSFMATYVPGLDLRE